MAKKTKARELKRHARQQDLPGTDDRAIKPLEDVATEYAEIRDDRMALNRREVELKGNALKLMKKYGKETYRRNGIEIRIVTGEEDVKVKIKKQDEADELEDAPSGEIDISAGGEV